MQKNTVVMGYLNRITQLRIITRCCSSSTSVRFPNLYFHPGWEQEKEEKFAQSFLIYDNFITEQEEENFMSEIEPHLKRQIYEKDHWDDAIQGFRETERKNFNKNNSPVIDRLRKISFPSSGKESQVLPYTHVLDLADFGFIKPHIDSSRFCGSTVAVLSLLSPCVARFRLDTNKDTMVDAFIDRRSLYVMKGFSRYDCTHEILKQEDSLFNSEVINKSRRVSIICRNEA